MYALKHGVLKRVRMQTYKEGEISLAKSRLAKYINLRSQGQISRPTLIYANDKVPAPGPHTLVSGSTVYQTQSPASQTPKPTNDEDITLNNHGNFKVIYKLEEDEKLDANSQVEFDTIITGSSSAGNVINCDTNTGFKCLVDTILMIEVTGHIDHSYLNPIIKINGCSNSDKRTVEYHIRDSIILMKTLCKVKKGDSLYLSFDENVNVKSGLTMCISLG